ncbi:ABC transporter permease [Nitratireductor sp. StC3]|uniref:ABC transporter permease n=1 Tax=Nitratireductor sp. StC3 TaxID=2126741 RepID=UPI000D0D73FD|nr:ABC transporter permease [Nitratireductor sp. StC3]PSM16792.1 sugar ABC transporter permease [Nitratireductor sp. StC3]
MKALLLRHETVLLAVIVLLVAIVGSLNPNFFSLINLLFLMKNSMVMLVLSLGFFLILVIGGLDISFAAVAVTAMYITLKVATGIDMEMGFVPILIGAAAIGAALGFLNGVLVSWLGVSSLIVTLGTMSLYRGFLLFFFGTEYLRKLPEGVIEFSRSNLFQVTAANGAKVGFHSSFLLVALIALAVGLLLRFTVVGRQAFAMGADRVAAARAGFRVGRIEIGFYALAGALAGIAGLLSASFIRVANPFSIIGMELDVIAAVVIGGAAITGGRGTVIGTVLGVALIAVLRNSLTLLSVPAYWHDLGVGMVILAAVVISSLRLAQTSAKP